MRVVEKIGYVAIVYWGYRLSRDVLYRIARIYLTPSSGSVDFLSMGKWAVITGCSHGIGKAYAEALAREGLNVVLISPEEPEVLRAIAKDIETFYKVRTKVVRLDFSEGWEMYGNVEREILGLDVGILVNNLGMSYPYPEYFLELPDNEVVYMNIIHCNVVFVTHMCRIMLPQMVLRGRGLIVNVASVVAVMPSPLLTVYAATKAYVVKFSKDLQSEYGKRGVMIQCLLPGTVTNHTADSPKPGWMIPTPENYVQSAVRTIGCENVTTGFFPHALVVSVVRIMYRISSTLVVFMITKFMEGNRRTALYRYID